MIILCLAAIVGLFWLAIKLTGAFLSAIVWIMCLPLALTFWVIGLLCCCTIILFPIGMTIMGIGTAFIKV